MPSAVRHITIDCADPFTLATFWAGVFGVAVDEEDEPGDPEALVAPESGPALLFLRVPEAKSVKNRVHLDLQPSGSRDDEVARLVSLGATVFADHRRSDGRGWVTLADPEGNEFCVELSSEERARLTT